jgi:hypothetical protein
MRGASGQVPERPLDRASDKALRGPLRACRKHRFRVIELLGFGLIDFEDPGGLDHWRLLLTFGEALGTVAVDIDASELFAVVVVDGDLPMAVLTSAVGLETG